VQPATQSRSHALQALIATEDNALPAEVVAVRGGVRLLMYVQAGVLQAIRTSKWSAATQ